MSEVLTSEKWCPSCKVSISTGRESCPTCLSDLVASSADLTCPRCRHKNSAGKDGCSECGAILVKSNDTDAFAAVIASGMRLPRPADVKPFSAGAAASLILTGPSNDHAFVSPDGWIEAYVEVQKNGSRYVTDVSGIPLFRLSSYKVVAERALGAFTPAGESVGTFIRSGELKPRIEVRDGTSAPVAYIQPGEEHGWDVVETGGTAFAHLEVTNQYTGAYVDDSWSLKSVRKGPLEVRSMLAILLAAKMLLGGTRQKVRTGSDDGGLSDSGGFLGLLGGLADIGFGDFGGGGDGGGGD